MVRNFPSDQLSSKIFTKGSFSHADVSLTGAGGKGEWIGFYVAFNSFGHINGIIEGLLLKTPFSIFYVLHQLSYMAVLFVLPSITVISY